MRSGTSPIGCGSKFCAKPRHFYVRSSDGDPIRDQNHDFGQVREKSKKLDVILDSVRLVKGDLDLPWLELDKAKLTGTFIEVPQREDMGIIVNEQLIVELYSK